MQLLQQNRIEERLNIGIKKLITMAETARQDSDKVNRFVELVSGPDFIIPTDNDNYTYDAYVLDTPANDTANPF